MHRFFVPAAARTGTEVALPAEESAHLVRVLRLRVRDAIRVFDGRGREWDAEVGEIDGARVQVRLGRAVEPAPEPRVATVLAVSLLKGDKMDEVVRDAVMLGVAAIHPIAAERSDAAVRQAERRGRLDRWQRIAIASAKQCGRAVVPEIAAVATLAEGLAAAAGLALFLTEPGAAAPGVVALADVPRAEAATIFVGPEGGWTGEELRQAADAGAVATTIGGLTLRADAVAIVALTALRALWDDL